MPRRLPAAELVRELVPVAAEGLAAAGVEADDAGALLSLIEERASSGTTGAVWQRRVLAWLEPRHGRDQGLARMLEEYLEHAARDEPVHRWPLP